MQSLSKTPLSTITSDTECTAVAGEFEGDNPLRNEIRVHRPMRHALGFNLSHWTPLQYDYSRRYPLRPGRHPSRRLCFCGVFWGGPNSYFQFVPPIRTKTSEKKRDFFGGFRRIGGTNAQVRNFCLILRTR